VARLEPVKDQAMLLRAFAAVRAVVPQARLCLVGDGSLRGSLERQAIAAGLGDAVMFLGQRADVEAILPAFDVFALSSSSEGLPLTILEAMAAGLPCVATDVGAVTDAVIAGETGLVTPPGDAPAFTAALLDLVRDPNRAQRMGDNGRRRAHSHFDLRVMTRKYEDLWGG
jgi:glycosyltransferase involved in cell wall biosynthesis